MDGKNLTVKRLHDICEKIAIGEADFLSDKTKDKFRSLYRLIAERIRQQQNLIASQDSDKKKMSV